MIDTPDTGAGVLILLGILGIVLLYFAMSTFLPVVLGALALAVGLYVLYIVGVNLHRWATTAYDRRT